MVTFGSLRHSQPNTVRSAIAVGPLGCSGGADWPGSGVTAGLPMLRPGAAHAGGNATVTLICDCPLAARTNPANGASSSSSEIRGHALALLDNAGAVGVMPTPLERLKDTARLVQLGELELTPAQRSGLAQRLGGWVHSAWANLLGSLDFEAKTIWVKPGLHHNRQRFVFAHELGHAMLPAHRQAYVDDKVRLSDWVTDLLEREANQAAVELLFQGDRLREQADDSVISLGRAIEYGADFGAGIVATSRRIAEESRKEVAIAIAHKTKVGGLGPTHFYSSASFEERYRWRSGAGPAQLVRVLLKGAGPAIQPRFVLWTDVRGRETLVRVESFFTSYSAIVLFARETGLRAAKFRSELRSGEARALDAA